MNQMIRRMRIGKNLLAKISSALLPEPIVRVTPRNAMYANRSKYGYKTQPHRIAGETIGLLSTGIPCVAVGKDLVSLCCQYMRES